MTPRRNRRAGVEDRWKKADGTPSANAGAGKRWRARYVDEASREHARSFERKVDAQQWLDSIVSSQVTGSYVDPKLGKITFASFYREWSSRQVWVPGTTQAMDLAAHGVTFGNVAMADVRPSHLETWVKSMQDKPLAPGTIKTRFNNVRSVLRAARRDKVLAHDPSENVTLPRRRRAEAAMIIPTPQQIGALLDDADEDFDAFVGLCAFAGLRLGEAAALQVGDIDFLRREIRVERQVQRANGHAVEIRAPKYGSERTIPTPDGLLELLSLHIAHWRTGSDPGRWMFPGDGENPWHQNSVGYRWRKTRKAVGLSSLHLHHLRHFYASGLIAAGCDVVTVQRALGHSSPTVTLNTYSHLWPDADDRTRGAADALFRSSTKSTADGLRTKTSD
ncbi:tyrosine-type recombinase/integrase [Rhodococcus jostii]|uniref:tyrosine-type recombinase/integrase n=1 Tax=Rhodococcus jostii TaxID=132919 RepID=UPI0036258F96